MNIKIKPKELKILQNAQGLLSQNNGVAAQEILLKYARTKKLSSQGIYLLCISYAIAGQAKKAKELAIKLVKEQPNNIEYLKLLGSCNHESKQYEAAIKYFRKALLINENDTQTLSNLASSLKEMKEYSEAEEFYTLSLQKEANQPDALANFGLLMQLQNKTEDAITLQIKALKISPNHPQALYNLAYSYKEKGDKTTSLKYYDVLLKQISNHIPALIDSAQIFAELLQTDKTISILKHAETISPNNEAVLQNLGIAYKTQNNDKEAEIYFLKVQQENPTNKVVQYYLSMIKGEQNFDVPPEEYVEGLFDSYADSFDEHLVNKLNYHIPSLIRDLLDTQIDCNKKYNILDLGCGTGLSGKALEDIADTMTGIDLSSKMLQKAKERNVYTSLHVEGIDSHLETIKNNRPNIIISADVFVYIGDISRIFSLASKALNDGGIFIFSTESTDSTDSFILRDTGRFAHNPNYIKKLGENNNLDLKIIEKTIIRYDSDKPIHGHVYLYIK